MVIIMDVEDQEKKVTEELNEVRAKRKFLECVIRICKNDHLVLEEIEQAQHALCCLKKLLQSRNLEADQLSHINVPVEFLCPISGKIMNGPVYLKSDRAFDRASIEKWMRDPHRTCGQSKLVFSMFRMTADPPLGAKAIPEWCKKYLASAFRRLSSSSNLKEKKAAADDILYLTNNSVYARALFKQPSIDGFDVLFKALSTENIESDLREVLVSIFFKLTLEYRHKRFFLQNSLSPFILSRSLMFGTLKSRMTAANTIFSIVATDDEGSKIEKFGFTLRGLVGLLRVRDELAVHAAATALWQLCYPCIRNRRTAITDGAIDAIIEQLPMNIAVCELLAICVMLSKSISPFEAMKIRGLQTAKLLFGILKHEGYNHKCKEYCVVLLLTICESNNECLKWIKEQELASGTLVKVVATGSARAQEDAMDILHHITDHC